MTENRSPRPSPALVQRHLHGVELRPHGMNWSITRGRSVKAAVTRKASVSGSCRCSASYPTASTSGRSM